MGHLCVGFGFAVLSLGSRAPLAPNDFIKERQTTSMCVLAGLISQTTWTHLLNLMVSSCIQQLGELRQRSARGGLIIMHVP